MKISILTVNYNTEEHIVVLLEMLSQQTLAKSDFEIIITNNVQNDTLVTLTQPFTKQLNLRIVQSEKNVGFGRANNMAAAHATGEHLLIMNPDVQMIQDDYLEQLYHHAQQHPDYGVITTQLLNEHLEDRSEFYGYEFGHTLGFESQVCWFSGALLLVRPDVFKKIHGFDSDFFMYCEDVDLCYRIKKLGLSLVKIDTLKVSHIGGASEPHKNYDMHYRWYRSQLLFAHKHFTGAEFEQLLDHLEIKCNKRLWQYELLEFLRIKRFVFKLGQWRAMSDIVKKTRTETPSWLYFKLESDLV